MADKMKTHPMFEEVKAAIMGGKAPQEVSYIFHHADRRQLTSAVPNRSMLGSAPSDRAAL